MTVEHFLTRELDIRFIDARNIATEARINLGFYGYPTKDEEELIREEACRIFHAGRSQEDQCVMRRLSTKLEAVKIGQLIDSSSSDDSGAADSLSTTSTASSSSRRRHHLKSMWPLGAGRR